MCAVLHQYRPPAVERGGCMVTAVTETVTEGVLGGLVAVFWAGGTGVVDHGLAVLNPLTTLLAHVAGALSLQLTVLVVGLNRSV